MHITFLSVSFESESVIKKFRQTNRLSYSQIADPLTLSWRRPLSYRNQSIDLLRIDLFLCDNSLRHERVNMGPNTEPYGTPDNKVLQKFLFNFKNLNGIKHINPRFALSYLWEHKFK